MVDSIPVPTDLRDVVGTDRAALVSQSSTSSRMVADQHLLFDYHTSEQAQNAYDRLNWLHEYLPAPEVVVQQGQWLVTERPKGESAADPERHAEPGHLASRLAKALKLVHSLDVERCPFRRRWEDYAADIDRAASQQLIDPEQLPDPYCRYTVRELTEMFISGRPPVEDLVVAHGAPTVDDFYFSGDELTGVIAGPTFGVAERNADLAWLHRGVRETYGDEAVFSYYDSYGPGESLLAVDNFFLASFLLA